MTSQQFQSLYPDITPEHPLRTSVSERLAISVATAVLVFGGAYGDLLIAGAGLLLILFALLAITTKPRRRIRNEARNRFPGEDWAEYHLTRAVPVGLLAPLTWVAIAVITFAVLYLVPNEWAVWGALGAAVAAFVLTWIMPGLNPRWARNRDEGEPEPDPEQAERDMEQTSELR